MSNAEAAVRSTDAKKMKTEFCSDNSVSLPGIIPGSSGPVGFEPGMFKNEDENSSHSHTKLTKSEKDKSIDGQSKVQHFNRFNYYFPFKFIDLHSFSNRKRRRKTRNVISTRSIVIIKIRRSARKVANARRAMIVRRVENARKAKRRKIRIYHVCRHKMKHQRH